jgi:hypothetical protein
VSASDNPTNRGKPASNGTGHPPAAKPRTQPRRLVLLTGDERSAVERVLAEYSGAEAPGKDVHAEIDRLAGEHSGRLVAAEWLGPLGWTRFLWCREPRSGEPGA